jgi:alkaline phosphatase
MVARQLWSWVAALFAVGCIAAGDADAQTIYPVDRAEILVGARFDLKVEFPDTIPEADVSVTVDGRSLSDVFGRAATVVVNEDGWGKTAVWLKNAELSKPGRYKVEAKYPGGRASVTWEAFDTPPRVARNVILFIGDGLSVAHRTAARMMSKTIDKGRYGGDLAIDDMSNMALVSTSGIESIVTDSANSMSAYATGHKSCGGAMGVYCAGNRSPFDHPRVETLAELVKRRLDLGVGIVTTTDVTDATPAAMIAHTASRTTRSEIASMMYQARPDVLLGGGRAYFLPKAVEGSRRTDGSDYLELFRQQNYAHAETAAELASLAKKATTDKLLGLFSMASVDSALDRRVRQRNGTSSQPALTEMVRAALSVLVRRQAGFLLMVESGRIDEFSHALDWERAVYETIRLDNAVRVAKEWAAPRNDTLIVVVPDHGHPVSIIGTIDDEKPGPRLRDKFAVYDAKFPNYPKPDKDGFPPSVDVSRRLAFVFGAAPDHCSAGKPIASPTWPTERAPAGTDGYVANEKTCTPGSTRIQGNLPHLVGSGVHSADDVILTANGPGAERFRGHMENIRVFRAIASALGLGHRAK